MIIDTIHGLVDRRLASRKLPEQLAVNLTRAHLSLKEAGRN